VAKPEYRGTSSIDGNDPFGTQALAFPDQTDVGSPVTFEAFAFTGGDALAWTFDDGATASGERVVHAFAQPGVHRVTMTETSSGGQHATVEMDVRVWPAAGVAAATEDLGDHAVRMTAQVTGASGRPLQATWRVGDLVLHGLTVEHRFPSAGPVVVGLDVTDASGLVGHGDVVVNAG
jgi:PKD repeat protein